jgi:hypothetical protein
MGNSPSAVSASLLPQSLPGSALQLCLNIVFANDLGAVTYPQHWSYHNAVRLHNTDAPVRVQPAAVVRPTNAEQISAVLKCAVWEGVKVQARSGGHSYANYGKQPNLPYRIS